MGPVGVNDLPTRTRTPDPRPTAQVGEESERAIDYGDAAAGARIGDRSEKRASS
jgi:hypothetical protein